MRSLVGILILLAVASATQYTPLSKVEYGLSIGDPAGSLHIQAFYDLLCPDSQASNSVLRDVFKTIIPAKSGIRFTYVFFPLPYHFYSFKVQQGYNYIRNRSGDAAALKYMQFVFDTQNYFDEFMWRNQSISAFITNFSNVVSQNLNVSASDFAKALALGAPEDGASRREWKYGGAEAHISGTPIFYSNGVRIDGAEDWKYSEWLDFLEKNISPSKKSSSKDQPKDIEETGAMFGLRKIRTEDEP